MRRTKTPQTGPTLRRAIHTPGPGRSSFSKMMLPVVCASLVLLGSFPTHVEPKSIEDLKLERPHELGPNSLGAEKASTLAPTQQQQQQQHRHEVSTLKPLAPTTLSDILEKLTSVFVSTSTSGGTTPSPKNTSSSPPESTTAHAHHQGAPSTSLTTSPGLGSVEDVDNPIPIRPEPTTATTSATTSTTGATTSAEENDQDDEHGQEEQDDDSCQGLATSDTDANGKPLTDNQRLVNLQNCFQAKVKRKLAGATRSGLELFEKVSLSGGCTASLMSLMTNLGELKSFAFKFIDATAKVPSGMMYGLLSDFGDFDQCLSIRSQPGVDPRDEEEERAFSGKYCLLNVKLKYHVTLNRTHAYDPRNSSNPPPEGIYPDGVLWDELVRQYWITNSSKGFQVGVCVPSRCTLDDLEQIYRLAAESYYFDGEVTACQDTLDLRRQQTPDLLQLIIIHFFLFVLALNMVGSLVERYCTENTHKDSTWSTPLAALTCFSIQRNWRFFLRGHNEAGRELYHHHSQRRPDDCCQVDFESCDSSSFMEASSSSASTSSEPSELVRIDPSNSEEKSKNGTQQVAYKPLTVRIQPETRTLEGQNDARESTTDQLLSHLSGMKLFVIVWITVGHSFLYPSANNYQYYRSIINMNITRDSVWFATTNFTLGIDTLLYMTGLVFVYKLARVSTRNRHLRRSDSSSPGRNQKGQTGIRYPDGPAVLWLILRRVLRFWPAYTSAILLAIVVPLTSDGPMWPEMVSHRLGDTCRSHWWANLLMINNFFPESQVCLPSSWFVSVLMQCFLVGSLVILLARRHSPQLAIILIVLILVSSSGISFAMAYLNQVGAPAIKMDESFVMELDGNIFRMYTNTFNNLGPFLVGMLGGFLLLRWRQTKSTGSSGAATPNTIKRQEEGKRPRPPLEHTNSIERLSSLMFQLNLAFAMTLTGALVLSSVFFANYTPFWAAVYWSCHRIGWALVTGYVIHQCATGRWQLLKDLLSLSSFIPLSRLIFIAYLIFPIFIHVHSGLVRDGLHVSIYNMLNIYITRLVMTFTVALILHLFVELPFCSLDELLLNEWLGRGKRRVVNSGQAYQKCDPKTDNDGLVNEKTIHPLLAFASALESKPTRMPEDNEVKAEK
ncbi:Hypothetical predicted protein [Olea europaea subsp. europaea]|uniref:Nose resistant-to-fluoxetine protein N-terminal domain-containing protein n=1 Tax=Olea europaea subsp. europaea TaxID=158383 RepID=A0A8S0TSB5_OLEEU|nr:Hypothetical predicted protein [Olea europaea subsp. europaea]